MLQWLMAHHKVIDIITQVISGCSVAHTLLPPWDWKPDFVTVGLSEFPTTQKVFYRTFNNRWYRLLVYVVGFAAINMRSTVWRYISVNNPKGPNAINGNSKGESANTLAATQGQGAAGGGTVD